MFSNYRNRAGGILLFGLFLLWACSGQIDRKPASSGSEASEDQSTDEKAVISFDTVAHDFGTIIEGEMVVCYFEYSNDGEQDLVINDVEVGCGCTSPDWSSEPLSPGGIRQLKIIFDSSGTAGIQRKSVTVVSNARNPRVRLTLTALVEAS